MIGGAANFRDLGGYPAADGRVVKHGCVYRSGHLGHITGEDRAAIGRLGVRYIFDLRSDGERTELNCRWTGDDIEFCAVPLGNKQLVGGLGAYLKRLITMDEQQTVELMYELMVDLAINEADQFGQLIGALARGQVPAILHCTAGKDRTGLASALLLSLLGTPRDAVYGEYLKTTPIPMSSMPAPLRLLKPGVTRALVGVNLEYLKAAFAAIEWKFGSFESYTREGLGLTPEQVRSLRERLTERGPAYRV